MLILALSALFGANALASGLDGSRWKLRENTFKSKIFFWSYDHLAFRDGIFESTHCRLKDFPPVVYASSESNGVIRWSATATGPRGKMVWEGRSQGDRMEGRRTWIRPDDRTRAVFWTGKRSSPK